MLFTTDTSVIDIGMGIMRIMLPGYTIYVFIEILAGALRGTGDVIIPMIITCGGICVLRVVWILIAMPMRPQRSVPLFSATRSHGSLQQCCLFCTILSASASKYGEKRRNRPDPGGKNQPRISITRSAWRARSMLWVTMITVFLYCRHSPLSRLKEIWADCSSKAPVGSSARISFPGFSIVRARATLCCSPPDSVLTGAF